MAKPKFQHKPKDSKSVIRYAEHVGATVTYGGKHLHINLPNGRTVAASSTPSDVMTGRALFTQLKHAGMPMQPNW